MLEKTGKVRSGSKTKTRVRVVADGRARVKSDHLATEEPMEIRLLTGAARQTVAVTMRTPGADFELAAGFLYGEGIVSSPDDIAKISYCVDSDIDAEQQYNIVNVELRGGREYDLRSLERHFYTTSACGVCGKASLEQLELRGGPGGGPGPAGPAGATCGLRRGEAGAAGAARLPGRGARARGLRRDDLPVAGKAERSPRPLRGDGRASRGGALRFRRPPAGAARGRREP